MAEGNSSVGKGPRTPSHKPASLSLFLFLGVERRREESSLVDTNRWNVVRKGTRGPGHGEWRCSRVSLLEREPRYKPECARILRAHRRCIQRIGKMAVIASRPAKKLRNASLTRPISLGLTPGRREWLIIVAEACWIFSSFFIFTFFLFAAITIRHHLYFLTERNRNALASLDV